MVAVFMNEYPVSSNLKSVWDYPRPPRIEPTRRHLEILFAGIKIADTTRAWRILETSHPPVYYFPAEDVLIDYLVKSPRRTFCEWKGSAIYFSINVKGRIAQDAAWSYPDPVSKYQAIRDHFAFYPQKMDACYVDGELVRPQPGLFYGGWITSDLIGPFKGEPGSEGW